MDGGLLIVNEKETKQIKSSMGKSLTDMQKFHDMCAYNLNWDMIWLYLPVATCRRVQALNLF
jgi:hypothetical protein